MSTTSGLSHLFRALKAPAAARALPKLAERAGAEDWSYERFAEALLSTEHASREAHGGEGRIKAARFPARKTLEEFDFTFQRSVKKTLIQHLGQLDFLHGRKNVVLLGPPGTGKTHPRSPWGSAPAWPATASPSAPPPNGSRSWPTPNEVAASTTN
jgi:DNA replication protein DnaC